MLNIDEEIKHVELGDREVKKWRIGNNKILLYSKYPDFKSLKQDFNSYQEMPIDFQHESDWKSIELFNFDNKTRYEKMAHEFLKNDINDSLFDKRYSPALESAALMKPIDIRSKYLSECATEDIVDRVDADNSVRFLGTPYFTSNEMEHLGVSYLSENPMYSKDAFKTDLDAAEWYKHYCNRLNGFGSTMSRYTDWDNTLKKLYIKLSKVSDAKDINAVKQSILDLGWNPEIKYNESAKRFASQRVSKIISESVSNYTILDVSESVKNAKNAFTETSLDVYPLYVVFFNSETFFNKLTRIATKSVYSHSALSFDASMKTLYSFSFPGGFQAQSLKDRTSDKAIQVYAVFVSKERYNKLKQKIEKLKESHADYSLINLITIPLNINYVDNVKMVCSQFVDSMLKLADVDITKIGSNMVSPGSLNRAVKKKKYQAFIYKVFYGSPKKYSAAKVLSYIDSLSKSNAPKTENTLIDSFSCIMEAKEWPIQFDDDGNLLIDKGLDVDFEAEYSTTHLALKQYEKAKNVEGMKYCLCKLWYLNTILEEKIHQEHSKKKIQEYHKARAKIINDITKYMAIVQKYDKNFDMLKEYQDSPFSDDRVKIRRSTLLYTIDLFKRIIGIK